MKIFRFEDSTGNIRTGVPAGEGEARVMEGDLFTGLKDTGEDLAVERILAPLVPVAIYGIGLNYRDHAEETGAELPKYPVMFMKPPSAVSGPGDPIPVPACCVRGDELDLEAELAVIIGKVARNVSVDEALDYVFGYTVANDVSARRWQKHAGGKQWVRSKGFDGFCPLGPHIVTADEIPDPQTLAVTSSINGKPMQNGKTADMIFSVAEIIGYMSQDTSLQPGTVIMTGTPAGVGVARKPPVWLTVGDEVEVAVEGIGALVNPVTDPAP